MEKIEFDAAVRGISPRLLIGGAWREASGGRTFPVIDPASGQQIAQVADARADDGVAALQSAHDAQAEWAACPARYRSEILRIAFERTLAGQSELATLIVAEMGKPYDEARAEVVYAAEFLRWFAEEAPRIGGRTQTSPEGNLRIMTTKRPVGPSLFITPWNFPIAMATRKIAPALAAGCTCVLKPAEQTPLTALAFGQILVDSGLPPGVVNIIPTTDAPGVTGPLLRDPRLRKLSFTGSTAVGRVLLRDGAHNVLRTSMELGGCAPFIVFEDADLASAVRGAIQAKLRNMGEACTAASRFIVHERHADEFAARLTKAFADLTMGRGDEEGSQVGPLISAEQRASVHTLVQEAVSDGATCLTGGDVPSGGGYFYPPTVLVDVHPSSRIMRDEVFGPVAPITTFQDEDEAVALANDSQVGLAGYVFTNDLARGLRMSERLEIGMLGLNTGLISNPAAPFGGIKHSGLGREGGTEGIAEFLDTVYTATPV